jgi:hypothetical protein
MNGVFAVSVPGDECPVLEKKILDAGKTRSGYILACIRAFGISKKADELLNAVAGAESAETRALLVAELRRELLNPSPLVAPDAGASVLD